MPTALNINDILSKVEKLDKTDQLTLLEKLAALLQKEDTKNKPIKLSDISGIGSKIWKQTTIQEYIEQERR